MIWSHLRIITADHLDDSGLRLTLLLSPELVLELADGAAQAVVAISEDAAAFARGRQRLYAHHLTHRLLVSISHVQDFVVLVILGDRDRDFAASTDRHIGGDAFPRDHLAELVVSPVDLCCLVEPFLLRLERLLLSCH